MRALGRLMRRRPEPRVGAAGARLQELDEALMRLAFRSRSRRRDRVLVAITHAASYSRLWLALAAVLAVGGGERGRRSAGRGVIAIAIAAAFANGPAKALVRRRRPAWRSPPTLIRLPRSTSFPSGHSAAAFAFATGAATQWPTLGAMLAPVAGAVAYSRVHTGVHYPSDVLAGAAIGIGSGVLAARIPLGCAPAQRGDGTDLRGLPA